MIVFESKCISTCEHTKIVKGLSCHLLQTRLWSLWAGEDAGYTVSDSECEENVEKLKEEMTKVFNYSQGR